MTNSTSKEAPVLYVKVKQPGTVTEYAKATPADLVAAIKAMPSPARTLLLVDVVEDSSAMGQLRGKLEAAEQRVRELGGLLREALNEWDGGAWVDRATDLLDTLRSKPSADSEGKEDSGPAGADTPKTGLVSDVAPVVENTGHLSTSPGVPVAPADSGAVKPREAAGTATEATDNPGDGAGATSATGEDRPEHVPLDATTKEHGEAKPAEPEPCGWIGGIGRPILCMRPKGHAGVHHTHPLDADQPALKPSERCHATSKNSAGSVTQCVEERNHLGTHRGLGIEWPNQGEDYNGWADHAPPPESPTDLLRRPEPDWDNDFWQAEQALAKSEHHKAIRSVLLLLARKFNLESELSKAGRP